VEPAARRQVYQVGDLALDDGLALLDARVRVGHGGDQRLGVGVQRRINELLNVGLFHKLTQIYNANLVADVLGRGKVVGNVQIRDTQLFPNPHHEV